MSIVVNLIEQVRHFGATLRADPPDLVITPPGVVPAELKAKLKQHKPDILRRLELEESMRRLEAAGICIAVWDNGRMRVLVSEAETIDASNNGGTLYSPTDMLYYVQLEQHERRMLIDFKKHFGGTTEWRRDV